MPTKAAAHVQPRYLARRDEIIAVATDVLNEQGVGGFSLAAVGARLDMNPASLAYYFKRKEELAATCLLLTIDRLEAALLRAEGEGDPETRLAAFVRETFALRRRIRLGEEPALASFNEIRLIAPPLGARVMEAYWRLFHRVENLFVVPELSFIDASGRRMRARLVLEQLMWARVWLTDYDEADYGRAAERLSDVLIAGIAAPGAKWSPEHVPVAVEAIQAGTVSRDAYLLAATELINERGYKGASVDRIAARLNVTKGSFYHHNVGKNGLVMACFERSFAIIQSAQHEAAKKSDVAWQRLAQACVTLVAGHASGQKRLLRTYALSALPLSMRQAVIEKLQQCARRFAAVIGDGVADGSMRAVDPLIAAQAVMATINASAYVEFWGGEAARGADILSAYARPALVGLFAKP
jgi:AcrR family transcriptional regulator